MITQVFIPQLVQSLFGINWFAWICLFVNTSREKRGRGGGHGGPDCHKMCNCLENATNVTKVIKYPTKVLFNTTLFIKTFLELFFITKSRLVYLLFLQLILWEMALHLKNFELLKIVP
jgi:hypothetical protein